LILAKMKEQRWQRLNEINRARRENTTRKFH